MNKEAGYEYELPYWQRHQRVVGIDEAGRGPIAGPLVVAGVVFAPGTEDHEIYDSKALSEKKRLQLFRRIVQQAESWKIIIVSPRQIDELNIYRATQQAMEQIAAELDCEAALTDAMPLPHCGKPVIPIVKGDQKSLSIAAGSILAKVVRDHIMMGYDHLYPQYGFRRHKGYPTREHLAVLQQLPLLPIYRMTYGPVARRCQLTLDLD